VREILDELGIGTIQKSPEASKKKIFKKSNFLSYDTDLQGVANDFTEMFTATGIEVLGTPIGTDAYTKDFVAQNSIKIMRDVEKLEPLTDGFSHFSVGTEDYEHAHTIHECKYNFAVPRAILNGAGHSYRYSHHKSYTPERYSRFFPSLGPG
jgi:hypothetical protein